jgi:integrase
MGSIPRRRSFRFSVRISRASLLKKVLTPIWTVIPETASRVRGRIEKILEYAKSSSYRDGDNPARWSGHLEYHFPSVSSIKEEIHYAALPYGEMPTFMVELQQREEVDARLLEFSALTGVRPTEARKATWAEINSADRVWTIGANRMKARNGKARKEHQVPLCERALAIVEMMREIRQDDFVFPGAEPGQPLSHSAIYYLLDRLGRRGELTAHGFRATFRTWADECTDYPEPVKDEALAHKVENSVEE